MALNGSTPASEPHLCYPSRQLVDELAHSVTILREGVVDAQLRWENVHA